MRVLLAHNSLYYPSAGGGDKSNRLLMEALATRGHSVRVVTRVERFGDAGHAAHIVELAQRGIQPVEDADSLRYSLGGVDVRVLTRGTHLRAFFSRHLAEFDPDVILCSTDDPAHLLFDLALKAPPARVVYLVRATIAVPFGPDSSSASVERTAALRQADGVVCVSEYVASYVRQWGEMDAVHLPIALFEPGEPAPLGRFDNPFVLIVNPCAVKGISILLDLAAKLPDVRFGAVAGWGTTETDLQSMRRFPNITLLNRTDNIDDLLRQARIVLVPSLWAEARSRVVPESLARGVPVIAADTGGLREAMLGLDYLLPVRVITHYQPSVDEHMVPVADVPPQDMEPWRKALERLWSDRAHWEDLARRSRAAGLAYLKSVTVEPFERYLLNLPRKARTSPTRELSDERRRLLEIRLKRRSAAGSWFPSPIPNTGIRLFCFPYAGAGALTFRGWSERLGPAFTVCPVQLPGRETRAKEPPFTQIELLIDALVREFGPLTDIPYALFGHSMGAGIAFELTRRLVEMGKRSPRALAVSAARAPRFRTAPLSSALPSDEDLLARLPQGAGARALSALRADTTLYRNYVHRPGPLLSVPILAYGGDCDPDVTLDHLKGWHEQTSDRFFLRQFPGGHLYFTDAAVREVFLLALKDDLRAAIAESVPQALQ